jgi:hypothetical protein
MGWSVDAGPMHFGSSGMTLRPQMKLGYSDDNIQLEAGLDDVRNGLSGGVAGRFHRIYTAQGGSIKEARVMRTLLETNSIAVACCQITVIGLLHWR